MTLVTKTFPLLRLFGLYAHRMVRSGHIAHVCSHFGVVNNGAGGAEAAEGVFVVKYLVWLSDFGEVDS